MKHRIEIYSFAYNKILGGIRKIDVRLYSDAVRGVRVGDMIEYAERGTNNVLLREVKGVALFQNFESAISMLEPQLIGYNSREEIRLRLERLYTKEDEKKFGVSVLFIDEPEIMQINKLRNSVARSA